MTDETHDNTTSPRTDNIGIHVGTLLLIACFFLPWTGGYTAVELSFSEAKARTGLMLLGISTTHALDYTRVLYMIPLLALATLMLEYTIPPGHAGRRLAHVSMLAAGVTLSVFLTGLGVRYGADLAYGFWWSLSGALFVTVGGVFNVVRNT
ncbi:MAG TPA: hypothetical protein VMY39_01635 [Planctomycetota bacterium]|nr:hypothetical protein [Planctomycetota bacterium]